MFAEGRPAFRQMIPDKRHKLAASVFASDFLVWRTLALLPDLFGRARLR
jgi:hypothetical protein